MAFDEGLAERLREWLNGVAQAGITEKRMFGGLAFMLNGNMCCGVVNDRLMVRVGAEQYDEALKLPHAAPMDFTGKPLRGFVYVDADGIAEDESLHSWLKRGVEFANSLPAK